MHRQTPIIKIIVAIAAKNFRFHLLQLSIFGQYFQTLAKIYFLEILLREVIIRLLKKSFRTSSKKFPVIYFHNCQSANNRTKAPDACKNIPSECNCERTSAKTLPSHSFCNCQPANNFCRNDFFSEFIHKKSYDLHLHHWLFYNFCNAT